MGLLLIFLLVFLMSEDNNTVVTLKVRVTPEFREKIVETAKRNNRSMNAEIVHRLEDSFKSSSSGLDVNSPLFYAASLSTEISKLRAKSEALKFSIETAKHEKMIVRMTAVLEFVEFEIINCHAELIKILQDNDLNENDFSSERVSRTIKNEMKIYFERFEKLSDKQMSILYPEWGTW